MIKGIGKLAIVGASARAAAFSALRAGFEVVTADLFADADLRRACSAARVTNYPAALADWLTATRCDAWMYTGALENYPQLVDEMAASRPLLGNRGAALRQVRDPLLIQQALGAAGLWFPKTTKSHASVPSDGSWLCKTYRGSSGAGVWQLSSEAQRMRAVRENAVFQRQVKGLPAAAAFAVFKGFSRLLGVTQQLLGPNGRGSKQWRYRGSLGALTTNASVTAQLEKLGEVLATCFDLRGLVGVDLVIERDRAWIVEINPRYSASMEIVEQASGHSVTTAHVAACSTTPARAPVTEIDSTSTEVDDMRYGKVILFARNDTVVADEFFRWAIAQTGVEPASCELADVPAAGERIPAGSPVLTVFASGADCRRHLDERLADVERRLYAAR